MFLRHISKALVGRGARKPERNVFGCDVEKAAFFHLAASFDEGFPEENFFKRDFLRLRREDFRNIMFDALVGNPPYVSYHNMNAAQRRAVRSLKDLEIKLQGRASLWAYFVAHSLHFLKHGGRMGWILPGSLVHTDYGVDLLTNLAKIFRQVTAIKLQQRCFGHVGTDESTVMLLCEDRSSFNESGKADIVDVKGVGECAALVGRLTGGIDRGLRIVPSDIDSEIANAYDEIRSTPGVRRLGELAGVKIGVVTGANKFFLVSQSKAKGLGLPKEALLPFLCRFYQAKGLFLKESDLNEMLLEDDACLFVDTRECEYDHRVQKYLKAFDTVARESNETFKKNEKWHQPPMGTIPDAFLSYMHHTGPRLVSNEANVYCTNSVHRVYFKPRISALHRLALAISVVSTIGQFSAEIEGRSYGSGVLKIEPSEAKQILVVAPPQADLGKLRAQAREIDALLRVGQAVKARCLADSCVYNLVPAIARRISQTRLRELLIILRNRRTSKLKLVVRKDDASRV